LANFKSFKTYAFIYSLNKGKMNSTEMDEVEVIGELENNMYKVRYKDIICKAMFNGFNCCYYADDVYGIIKEDTMNKGE